MHQMLSFAQQALSLANGLADQRNFTVLEIAEAAMYDSRRSAGHPRSEVVLLDQQRALSGASAFARHCHTVNAPPKDDYLEVLAL
jgi:hypothetical protein